MPRDKDTSSTLATHPQRRQLFFLSPGTGHINAPHHGHSGPHTILPSYPPLSRDLLDRQPHEAEDDVADDRAENEIAEPHLLKAS
jgi:hypothetical protein